MRIKTRNLRKSIIFIVSCSIRIIRAKTKRHTTSQKVYTTLTANFKRYILTLSCSFASFVKYKSTACFQKYNFQLSKPNVLLAVYNNKILIMSPGVAEQVSQTRASVKPVHAAFKNISLLRKRTTHSSYFRKVRAQVVHAFKRDNVDLSTMLRVRQILNSAVHHWICSAQTSGSHHLSTGKTFVAGNLCSMAEQMCRKGCFSNFCQFFLKNLQKLRLGQGSAVI